MKAFTQGRYNRNNEQQHRRFSASFRPYEEPPASPVVLVPPSEFMYDIGDGKMVDLSNLVSPKSRMKPPPPSCLPPPAPRPPPVRKQKSRARLYPTEDMVAPLPDLRTEDLLAKCSVRRGKPTPVREMERMGSWRRSKTGDSTFYPASRDQRYEQLPPGAYDFNPSTESSYMPEAHSRRDSYSVCSNNSNGNSYDGGYPTNKHSSNNSYGYQNDYDRNNHHESHSYKITSPPPPPPPEYDHLQVEICPGHYAALRGSEETWGAIQRGFCSNVNCFNCGLALVCIADAEYVLCPECRVVSPVLIEEEPLMDCKIPARNSYGQQPAFRGGVGLGLRARQAPSMGVASSSYGGY